MLLRGMITQFKTQFYCAYMKTGFWLLNFFPQTHNNFILHLKVLRFNYIWIIYKNHKYFLCAKISPIVHNLKMTKAICTLEKARRKTSLFLDRARESENQRIIPWKKRLNRSKQRWYCKLFWNALYSIPSYLPFWWHVWNLTIRG